MIDRTSRYQDVLSDQPYLATRTPALVWLASTPSRKGWWKEVAGRVGFSETTKSLLITMPIKVK